MTRDQRYSRNLMAGVTDLERLEMAQKLLETSKVMQIQGLKRILGDEIEDPLIPRAAREHAERAYAIASMLEREVDWSSREFKLWMRLKHFKLKDGAEMAAGALEHIPDEVVGPGGLAVPVPEYMRTELQNLRMALDYEIFQVGRIAGEIVYEDIIAETTAQKRPLGGILRDGRPTEVIETEEAQS